MFERIKRKLNITWSDEDTDTKIREIMEDAKAILNHKLGAEIDYSINGMERQLYLNYCMYAWNNCVDEFDKAYLSEILTIRHKYEVAAAREAAGETEQL